MRGGCILRQKVRGISPTCPTKRSALNKVKTESIRKLSNQWTKTLKQNNLKYIAFFFTLLRAIDVIMEFLMEAREIKFQISQELCKHR